MARLHDIKFLVLTSINGSKHNCEFLHIFYNEDPTDPLAPSTKLYLLLLVKAISPCMLPSFSDHTNPGPSHSHLLKESLFTHPPIQPKQLPSSQH